MEIERKFLVDTPPPWLSDCPAEEIEQGYVTESGDSVQVRVRRKDAEWILAVKHGTGLAREESEVELSEEQARSIWPPTVARTSAFATPAGCSRGRATPRSSWRPSTPCASTSPRCRESRSSAATSTRFGASGTDPGSENVHEWRKRVKDLWYHLRILGPLWPEVLGETAEQAHELADLLGDHHDLAVLAEDARERHDHFGGEAQLQALLTAAANRQAALLASAVELGERLYAEKPKAFVRRVERYWTAWRPA